MIDFGHYIVRDSAICGGVPVIRGTRISLRTILASLAEGSTANDILADFPALTRDQLWAVIAFAASAASEILPEAGLPLD
ncbi:MAG: DUF433 domain-containing protein [Thermoanaerobaculia bacterium]